MLAEANFDLINSLVEKGHLANEYQFHRSCSMTPEPIQTASSLVEASLHLKSPASSNYSVWIKAPEDWEMELVALAWQMISSGGEDSARLHQLRFVVLTDTLSHGQISKSEVEVNLGNVSQGLRIWGPGMYLGPEVFAGEQAEAASQVLKESVKHDRTDTTTRSEEKQIWSIFAERKSHGLPDIARFAIMEGLMSS